MRGVTGGFMQVCHGKEAPLKRIKPNDWLIVYSPKLAMEGKTKCQSFTAIGQAKNQDIYQFQMSPSFNPFRKDIKFYKCQETSILPLINDLEFIQDKKKWGFPFRFGFYEIKEKDFNLIVSKMQPDEINRENI